MKKFLALGLSLCMSLFAFSGDAAAKVNKEDHFITVLTGPTSGIYFPIGGAFATALGNYGYTTSSTATGASAENINAILTGQGEMAIAMSDSLLQS